MEHWSAILSKSCDQIDQLKEFLRLSDADALSLKAVQEKFPILINPYYLSLINPDDPDDPVRKMCIPSVQELDAAGSTDTSGEKTNTILPGLQHKYAQTALLLSTHQCAMNCRHCFRRRMVGISDEESVTDIRKVAGYIRDHREITNVLISGGDAFMNSNDTIKTYLSLLCRIPHLDFIRFGTRTPVVLPQRITTDGELKGILANYSEQKQIYVVTQFNHPRELTAEAKQAITELTALGIPVRNQTVLLKGINDNPETLSGLLKSLTAAGIIPYYVFQCRPVIGVMNHFQIPLRTGYRIIQDTMNLQNGPGKNFRFMMSHVTGKIEILGMHGGDRMLFKYHQAKDPADQGRIFARKITETQCWL